MSNIVCGMTRRDTKTYTEKVCQSFSKNLRKLWAWVNTSKGKCTPIPSITDDGTRITDDAVKADKFLFCFHIGRYVQF